MKNKSLFEHFTSIIIVITFFTSIYLNRFSYLDFVLFLIDMIMCLFIVNKYSLFSHFGKYIILIAFWMSVIFIPSFHFGLQFGLNSGEISNLDYNNLLSFGVKVIFITCVLWILFALKKTNHQNTKLTYKPKVIKPFYIKVYFIFIFFLTFFSFILGLGRMGSETVVLPYHLGGLINLSRNTLSPALFAVIVENYILCKVRIPKRYFFIFFIWCIFETFTWLSKSILIMNFVPTILVLFFYYRPSFIVVGRYLFPLLLLFLFLYPVISILRNIDKGTPIIEIVEDTANWEEIDDNFSNSESSILIAPLNRTFMTCNLYTLDYSYINKSLFDFSRLARILSLRGSARYQTYVIDGYPLGVPHSSGTSGLMDPLLHGGYGLCYIVIIFLMLIANYVDGMIIKKQYSILVQFFIIIWVYCNYKNLSSFYDGVGMSTLIAQFFSVYIAYLINFKNSKIYE